MGYALELFLVIAIFFCAYTHASEGLDSLVAASTEGKTQFSGLTSVNVDWTAGDSEFDFIKKSKCCPKVRLYRARGLNKIISVYKGPTLVWQGDGSIYAKSVLYKLPSCGAKTIEIEMVSNGTTEERTFIEKDSFYYDTSTVVLNINDSKSCDDYKVIDNVKNKNGDREYEPLNEKKFSLVYFNNWHSRKRLFWKATSNWHCEKVVLTYVSDNLIKMALDITDGSANTKVVLVRQEDNIWVPENTVHLNTDKKDKVVNCVYTSNVVNNSGSYEYTPNDGYTITKVCHGDLTDDDKLVWQSAGGIHAKKVTVIVESKKTTQIKMDLVDEQDIEVKKTFHLRDKRWVEVGVKAEL